MVVIGSYGKAGKIRAVLALTGDESCMPITSEHIAASYFYFHGISSDVAPLTFMKDTF